MSEGFLVRRKDNKLYYSSAEILDNAASLKLIDHPIRIDILRRLAEKPMYPAELSKLLGLHEQKVYYHIKQLVNAGALVIAEKKEVRGTVAKRFKPKNLNFAIALSDEWKGISSLTKERISPMLGEFLSPFIAKGNLNASIVVGSPDPHGPYKARARDSHYAVELALMLGQFAQMPKDFCIKLDVDVSIERDDENLILVGGPITNLVVSMINHALPCQFIEHKPFTLKGKKDEYSEDSVGIIAKIPHPNFEGKMLLVLAGLRVIGTKASVMALTRHHQELLHRYNPDEPFCKVVQGFDMDSDGKIDSVEILE